MAAKEGIDVGIKAAIVVDKKLSDDIRSSIERSLMDRYEVAFSTEDYACFCYDDVFFKVSNLRWRKSDSEVIVVEYAENEAEAREGLFGEDGDMFYIDDMTEDEILESIIREVEG